MVLFAVEYRRQELRAALPERMARCGEGNSKLVNAAQAIYAKAWDPAYRRLKNGLLVYDLLLDSQDCVVARASRPARPALIFGAQAWRPALLQIPGHVNHHDPPVALYQEQRFEQRGALVVEQVMIPAAFH